MPPALRPSAGSVMMADRVSTLKTFRIAVGAALSLAAAAFASAQSFQVRTYTEADGLCSSVVQDIAQDAQGQIWFATRGGISVFDGSTWTSYVRPRDIPSANVLKLIIDKNGTVWAWAENVDEVLLKFSGGRWISIPKPPFISGAIRPTAMFVHGPREKETVALATRDHGLLVWEGGRWTQIDPKAGLPDPDVLGLALAGVRLYVATPGGLFFFEEGRLRRAFAANAPELSQAIYGLATEDSAFGPRLWLAGRDWLGTYSWEGFKILRRNLILHIDGTYPNVALAPDSRGGVYVGNPNAVFHLPPGGGDVEKIGKDSGLIAEGAADFLLDREKNLWIAGLRGVSKITSRRFANFREAQGLLEDEVTAMARWNGGLVFGHNTGLSFFVGTERRTLPFARRAGALDIDMRVSDMAVDGRRNLWVAATWRGLLRIAPDGTTRWFGPETGIEGQVGSVATAPDGSVWAACQNTLVHMSGDRAAPVFSQPPGDYYIRKIFFGRSGEMALASPAGLWVLENAVWKRYHNPGNRDVSNVYAALRDDDGRLLVGTMAGLMETKDGRLMPFAPAGLRIERPVFLILRDAKGRFWFGTDNGAIRWDGKEAREYTVKMGFAGQEVNRSAGLVDASGQLWIGTNLGASRYQEEFDYNPREIPPPLVQFLSIEAGGILYPVDRALRLPYSRNNVEFEFRAVSTADETAVRYRFRMDGFDRDWIEERPGAAGQIRYTNLQPGNYRLRLQAKSGSGPWSEAAVSPAITILLPFWRQWWFVGAAGLFLFFLGLVVFEIVAEKRHAVRLEKEVGERTAQIQASLEEKNVLLLEIHHRVKNNLQIVSSLLSLQAREIKDGPTQGLFRESIARIRAMALIHENLYRTSHLAHIDLADYIQRLVNDLQNAYAVQPDRVRIDVRAADVRLTIGTAVTCGLLLNEIVSNALKHAFPDERRGTIRITFDAEARGSEKGVPERECTLVVADDGVGMPEGFETLRFGSLGLRLIRSLTGQLGGTLAIENDGGAKFTIRFRA